MVSELATETKVYEFSYLWDQDFKNNENNDVKKFHKIRNYLLSPERFLLKTVQVSLQAGYWHGVRQLMIGIETSVVSQVRSIIMRII